MRDIFGRILRRRHAYRRLFLNGQGQLSPDGEAILKDLATFCRLHKSATVVSPISRTVDVPATFQAEGRREVLLRILGHLHVSDADLIRMEQADE